MLSQVTSTLHALGLCVYGVHRDRAKFSIIYGKLYCVPSNHKKNENFV